MASALKAINMDLLKETVCQRGGCSVSENTSLGAIAKLFFSRLKGASIIHASTKGTFDSSAPRINLVLSSSTLSLTVTRNFKKGCFEYDFGKHVSLFNGRHALSRHIKQFRTYLALFLTKVKQKEVRFLGFNAPS